MGNCIILASAVSAIVLLTVIGIVQKEKYKLLKNVGKFPLYNLTEKTLKSNDDIIHKYSGHRYKQKRRYNFLSQQNQRSYN